MLENQIQLQQIHKVSFISVQQRNRFIKLHMVPYEH
jgi:hypothetical protein